MEPKKNILVSILVATAVKAVLSTTSRPRGLEFIYPAEEILVSTNTELLPFTLILTTYGKYSDYQAVFTDINALITGVLEMAGLKDQDTLSGITRVLDDALLQLKDFENLIQLAHDYSNPSITDHPIHPCNLSYSGNFQLENVKVLRKELKTLRLGIDLTWTTAQLSSPLTGGAALMSFAFDVRDRINNLKRTLIEQVIRLDSLSRSEIPDDVPANMQNQPCYLHAQHENVKLRECTKINVGLACDFEVEIYSSLQNFIKMQPINYRSAELDITTPKSFLVKSINRFELGILNCTNSEQENVRTCKHSPWSNACATALSGTDYSQVVKVCNFTMKNPTNLRVLDGGILIQDPKTSIKIESKFPNARLLETRAPMVIYSKDPIELLLNEDGMRYTPESAEIEYEILYSLIDKEIINKMVVKAQISQEIPLGWLDLVNYLLLVIHTLTLPAIVYSLVVICRRRHPRQAIRSSILVDLHRHDYSRDRRENYNANKHFLRNVRDDPPSYAHARYARQPAEHII